MLFYLFIALIVVTIIIHTKINYGNSCIVITVNFKTLVNKIKDTVNKL